MPADATNRYASHWHRARAAERSRRTLLGATNGLERNDPMPWSILISQFDLPKVESQHHVSHAVDLLEGHGSTGHRHAFSLARNSSSAKLAENQNAASQPQLGAGTHGLTRAATTPALL